MFILAKENGPDNLSTTVRNVKTSHGKMPWTLEEDKETGERINYPSF